MTETSEHKFRAFLSYAHADSGIANWLHRALERFSIGRDLVGRPTPLGKVPASLAPIFRDRDDFAGGGALGTETVTAIDQSAALVVVCSPLAASRPAVNEEVRTFRSRHPERPVIPVIVDGTFPDNFPPALRYELAADGSVGSKPITVLGSDVRETADGRFLGLAKTVAGLLGVGTDEIVRREHRRQRRQMWSWIVGLSSVALLMAGLAAWAEINRFRAEKRYNLAADAAIDLAISHATTGFLQPGAPTGDTALFYEMLKFEKMHNRIFQRLVSEGRAVWECRKIARFEVLTNPQTDEQKSEMWDLLQASGASNEMQKTAARFGWAKASGQLKQQFGANCNAHPAGHWPAYDRALDAIDSFIRSYRI